MLYRKFSTELKGIDKWMGDGDDDVHNNNNNNAPKGNESGKKKQKNARTIDVTHIGIPRKHQIHFDNVFCFCHWHNACVSSCSQKKINSILACCFDNVNVEQTSFSAVNPF